MAVVTGQHGGGPGGPGRAGQAALMQLIADTPDGVGLLDEELRIVYVNPAGCAVLGQDLGDLIGTSSLRLRPAGTGATVQETLAELSDPRPGRRTAVVVRPDGRKRELEYTAIPVQQEGRRLIAGIFRDVTEARRAERWATAFVRITARMASAGAPEDILDELSRGVVEATGMVGCATILLDPGTGRFRLGGTGGVPPDYGRRLEAALAQGRDLPAVRAFRTGQTIVRRASEDPIPATDRASEHGVPWETVACVPMRVGGRTVGILESLLPSNLPPEPDVLAFVDAVGDQAAVAIENSRLFSEATGFSRRQEVLVQAGLALAVELSLPSVLTKLVEFACAVADATYGALGVLGADGGLEDFITFGVTEDQRTAVGDLPRGRGLLGALVTDARPVRLGRLREDPRSCGVPPNHPTVDSFLGVPVTVRGSVYGNLYLTGKRGAAEFTEADERAVVTLAAQAGVAIENARLFAEAQERLALEERTRLARELHDSVSQALFAMTLETGAAQITLQKGGSGPADLEQRLARLRELTDGALAEMRALIFALRPEAIREEGLVAAVRKQAEGIAAREDLDVTVHAPGGRLPLPVDAEEQLYRLTQEALSNVAKHAEAGHVRISIDLPAGAPAALTLEIADDGVGFDPSLPRPGHLGLRSMAQRVEDLGGQLEIRSRPGRGTVVRAVLPVATGTVAEDADPDVPRKPDGAG